MNYYEVIPRLNLPSLEQTSAFAHCIADHKQWAELLPVFPPGFVFAFYLDPYAGHFCELSSGVEQASPVATSDIRQAQRMLATVKGSLAEYQEAFGCWSFWWGDDAALRQFSPYVDAQCLECNASGQVVSYWGIRRLNLPAEIVWQCGCRLSAFVNGRASHRCSLERLRDFLVEFEDYAERSADAAQLENCKQLRQGLKAAKVFSLNPQASCEVEIGPTHAEIIVRETGDPGSTNSASKRCVVYECDFGNLVATQKAIQRDELLKALTRSREVFAKLHRRCREWCSKSY
jgi:hypothetical protein